MKPSFALDLRSSIVTLLHRTARGWSKVGEAALDAPDLAEAMAFMRSTALGLSPPGITTKLIIPNSQILYTKVTAPVSEPVSRARRIGAALEGLTPYRLDELVYDWCETGTGLQVAVLAKETLEEAETFARAHRFNPVSFVAVPEAGTYLGEPFFGTSKLSKSLLAKDETVERDSEAVRVVGRTAKAKPSAGVAAEATAAVQDQPVAKTSAPSVPPAPPEVLPPADDIAALALVAAEDTPVTVDNTPAIVEETPVVPAENGPVPAYAEPVASNNGDPAGAEPVLADTGQSDQSIGAPSAPDLEGSAPALDISTTSKAEVPEAPMLVDVDPEDADQPVAAKDVVANDLTAQNQSPTAPAKRAPPALRASAPAKDKASRDTALRAVGPAPAARGAVARPAAAKPLPKTAVAARPSAARPWQGTAITAAKDTAGIETGVATARSALGRIISEKGAATPTQRRYVILGLAAFLLALLVLVVIWSSLSLGTNEAGTPSATPAPVVAQSTVPESTVPESVGPASATAETSLAQTPVPESTAPPLPSVQDKAAANSAVTDAALPQTAPPDAALKSSSAGTDAPTASATGEALRASADSAPIRSDPIALPALQGAIDQPPVVPLAPPPYAANTAPPSPPAALIPTPEGVVTPEGVLLFAGRPPVVPPPARPTTLATIAKPDAADAAQIGPEAEAVVMQDPALAGLHPRNRPADLMAAAAASSAAVDAIAAKIDITGPRPRARPADLMPQGPVAEVPENDAVVVSSPKPPTRPADATTGIDDAVSDALNQEVAAVQPAAEPEPQPEGQAQPPAPTLPTNASVAKQATEKAAINANKVTLLGIFGTPTSRYAMIRLASGRVKKVIVGDTIEGGQIAAITPDSVKYQKGNRIITLSL